MKYCETLVLGHQVEVISRYGMENEVLWSVKFK